MSDEDIQEYHNIGRKIKHNGKYTYVDASRIEDQGTRLYDVNGSRLPSVTTVLGRTKNTEFLTKWKAKVGEAEVGGQLCTNSWNIIYSELATMILQNSDRRRKPWPRKLLMWVSHRLMNGTVRKLRYITRAYTQAQQTLSVRIMVLKLLLTSNKLTVRKRKNGSKIIICKSQRTPWHTTMSTTPKLNKELSWYARLTYITKNLK